MTIEKEEWVTVKSLSELKPGVVIKAVLTGVCGMLIGLVPQEFTFGCRDRGSHKCSVWIGTFGRGCLQSGISNGSLYRLETGQSDEEQRAEGEDLYAAKPKVIGRTPLLPVR